ncbi:MAG: hypothetical protein HYY40_09355 [Bacteroidetes bacterium]|nr:hypothetical protein [Bacteroidota bacterium]
MSFLRDIKLLFGNLVYRNRLAKSKRTRKVYNFDQAHSIGIIYDATDKDNYEKVKAFVQYLKDQKKQVRSLGYFSTRYPGYIFHPKLEFSSFSVKNVNFFLIPGGIEVRNFMNEEFNILIDLNMNNSFPLQYICGLSKANFKVGITGNGHDIYDMMIHIEKKKTLENLLDQVKKYLNMINKPVGV